VVDERDQSYLWEYCAPCRSTGMRVASSNQSELSHLNAFQYRGHVRESGLRKRVIALAGRLACPDKRYREWADAVWRLNMASLEDDEKQDMIHELEQLVAHLYGLSDNNSRTFS